MSRSNDTAPRGVRTFIVVLVMVYCAKQFVTAVLFPPFTGHDELAHFEYVRILASERRIPTLGTDALPADLYEFRRYALQWSESNRYTAPMYSSVHPPLYYLAMVPFYNAAADLSVTERQYVLRFAAIPFGIATLLLAYLLARTVFPADGFLAVTVPALVAFQPQVSYEAAMVNNDIVAIALYSWILLLLVRALRDGMSMRLAAVLGTAVGFGLLAKVTTIAALPLLAAVFWWTRGGRSVRHVVTTIMLTAGIAVAIAAPWYSFMIRTYGDPTGLQRVAALQAELLSTDSFVRLLFSGEFAVARWTETWGQFGWRLIVIDGRLISATAVGAALGVFGLLAYAAAPIERRRVDVWQVRALLLLGVACVISYLAVVEFGTRFALTQARYYFPVVNAAALLAMVGMRAWTPLGWRTAAQGAFVLGMLVLNLRIYTSHVVPFWYFRP